MSIIFPSLPALVPAAWLARPDAVHSPRASRRRPERGSLAPASPRAGAAVPLPAALHLPHEAALHYDDLRRLWRELARHGRACAQATATGEPPARRAQRARMGEGLALKAANCTAALCAELRRRPECLAALHREAARAGSAASAERFAAALAAAGGGSGGVSRW